MTTTKILIIICSILLSILYIQAYLKPKTEYTILQSYLDKLKPESLYDKYPIIIYDSVKNPEDLLSSLFAYSFAFKSTKDITSNMIYQANSKFTLIYTNSENGSLINIISPKYKVNKKKNIDNQDSSVQYITIKMKPYQVMILPMFWHYCLTDNAYSISLDDVVSKLYNVIYSK